MKLRIKGNSLRLRLLQSEVAQIAEGKKVEEITIFNFKQQLSYSLSISHNISEPKAEFLNGSLTVLLPAQVANDWANSNQVGIETYQATGNDEKLHILIEKDFKCLDTNLDDDQSDNFPHPKEGAVAC
ncbi:MAG: hypothetical protein MUE85_14790 [Microscillaceae bacterium]|jgi:hypothetical protein|nr:hypothetical protein [Microscillaceae bacterium]